MRLDCTCVQGDCAAPPTKAEMAILARTPGAVALLPFQPGQCLIMAYEDFLQVNSYRCSRPSISSCC